MSGTNNPWFGATMALGGLVVGYIIANGMGGLNLPSNPAAGGTGGGQAGAQVAPPSRFSSFTEALTAYAKEIDGLNVSDFSKCVSNGTNAQEAKDDMSDGTSAGISGTPGFWILGPGGKAKLVSGAYPFETFKETVDAMLNNDPNFVSDAGTPPTVDDDAVKGDANAPVTIIEFTDYQCPFCSRHFEQTFGQIESEYIDTGKVKYVVRDFPLGFHPNAQKAAEAAECAGDQGRYWEMHDQLFSNQGEWSGLQ